MNCLSVFDHFLGLTLKGLRKLLITLDVEESKNNFPVLRISVEIDSSAMMLQHAHIIFSTAIHNMIGQM